MSGLFGGRFLCGCHLQVGYFLEVLGGGEGELQTCLLVVLAVEEGLFLVHLNLVGLFSILDVLFRGGSVAEVKLGFNFAFGLYFAFEGEVWLGVVFVDVFLVVDVFEYDVGAFDGVLLDDWLVDELGAEVDFEGGLEEEGDVVEEEAEGEVAELVLHERSVVQVVRTQVLLRLFQQFLSLQLVVYQLALLLVHLRLQTAQPTI
jgi:hypothetical protein